MRSMKSIFGMVGTLVAIAYCGGLAFYFLDLTGSMREAQDQGLGPTVLGLSAFGVLFGLVLIVQIIRFVMKLLSRRAGGNGPGAAPRGGKGGFDSEAAFERYMAQRPVDAPSITPAPPPTARQGGGPPKPQGFGRKNR